MKKIKLIVGSILIGSSLLCGCGEKEPTYECSDREKAIEYCEQCTYDIQLDIVDSCSTLRKTFEESDGGISSTEETTLSALSRVGNEAIDEIYEIQLNLEGADDISVKEVNNSYLEVKKIYNNYFNKDNSSQE